MPHKTTANRINHRGFRGFNFRGRAFDALCRMHPPRPIRDAVDLDNATEIIDAMAGHKLTADQADYLDTLATLIERYESENDPVDTSAVTGADLLRSLMEANDMTTSDVGAILNVDRSHISHLLAGRRGMTWDHAKALADRFGLSPAVFMD
ncbi:MAG: helix-turn-helix domain-containing protein [Phycisphaeraceae bacterium]